jgi:hypothetical protein
MAMAKYTITHSCGHPQDHQIYGTNTRGQREWQAAQRAKTPCADCVGATRAELADRAATVAQDAGWPTLVGSDKQIAWAQSLRADAVAALAAELGDHPRVPAAVRDEVIDLYVRVAVRETDASWWIDRMASRYIKPAGLPAQSVHNRMTEADRAELAALRERATQPPTGRDDDPTAGSPAATASTTETAPTAEPAQMVAALRAGGRTVRQIAAAIGCAVSTVYRWGRGVHCPSPRYAAALAAIA